MLFLLTFVVPCSQPLCCYVPSCADGKFDLAVVCFSYVVGDWLYEVGVDFDCGAGAHHCDSDPKLGEIACLEDNAFGTLHRPAGDEHAL